MGSRFGYGLIGTVASLTAAMCFVGVTACGDDDDDDSNTKSSCEKLADVGALCPDLWKPGCQQVVAAKDQSLCAAGIDVYSCYGCGTSTCTGTSTLTATGTSTNTSTGTGTGTGIDCNQLCSDVYTCGQESGGSGQLCPGFTPSCVSESAYLNGSGGGSTGCLAVCASPTGPVLAGLDNPSDCAATVTALKGADADFQAACEGAACGTGTGTGVSGSGGGSP